MIPFTALNVGFANAENYRRRENKELLAKFFVRDEFLERLLDSNIFFLIGEKGTGKTAYSTYLRNDLYRGRRSFTYDVRQTEYQKFLEMKRAGHLPLSQYSEVWRTLILILAAVSIIDSRDYIKLVARFTKLQSLKDMLDEFYNNAFSPEIVKILSFVDSSERASGLMAKYLGLGGQIKVSDKLQVTEEASSFQTNLLMIKRSFEEIIDQVKLENDFIIFIDGIDVRPSEINYQDYFECVRGLIEATWAINSDFLANIKDSRGRIRIVLLVRPDIFLKAGLHNVNTKLRDNSVLLNWGTTYKDYRSSSLFKIADRLLAAQQPEPSLEVGQSWDHYFPFHAENVNSVDIADEHKVNSFIAFLRFSYYRPRDISAMIGTMKDILSKTGEHKYVNVDNFNDPSFRNAHADYLLGEIKDQMLFYYSQTEFELFLQFFSHLLGKQKFSYKQFGEAFNSFISECAGSGKDLPQFFESKDVFLQFLYEQNVVCYIESDENRSKSGKFIRWCFRERTMSNLSPKVRTHVDYEIFYGLTKALNIGKKIRVRKEPSKREIGTIAVLNKDKRFGFIRGGSEQNEYYFKFQSLRYENRQPSIGDKVSFEVSVKYGKLRAELIQPQSSGSRNRAAQKANP